MSFFATYDGSSYQLTTAGFTALVIIMIAILLIGCAIFGGKKKFCAKQLAFSAMAIALAMVTSMIKLFDMPMGGSVTLLSMLFIVLIGYWYGLGAGLTAAFAYGILQLVVDPYIISVPQMLVDYLFAFLSGWIFFGMYAPEEFPNAVVYSLAYNGAYLGAEALITLIIICLPPVQKALNAVKNMANS